MQTEIKEQKLQTKPQLRPQLIAIFATALGLDLVIELLGRSSVVSLWEHIIYQPIFFLYNLLLLAFTLSISLFFTRKALVRAIVAILWLAVGVTNFVVLSYRITPFSAIDLLILNFNLSFIKTYANLPQVLLFLGVLVVVVVGLVQIYRRCPSTAPLPKVGGIVAGLLLLSVVGLTQLFFALDLFESRISDMQSAYEQFGVVSCFTRSVMERGIDQPEDYSEELVEEVLEELPVEESTPTITPNVVVVQLESFFDPSLLCDTTFSENPIPTFTQLMADYSSGALFVPVVGAGTANTEFEVLTGMSVDYFGTGEFPYETVLQERSCESVAYHLKSLGYHTTAMHNNTATFYHRNLVYPNLGFDTFISSEFMADTTTPQGWIKDECLTGEIAQVLTTTEEPDFIFAVSVQGHGPFPTELTEPLDIQVTSSPFETELETQLEYYINQLYEMDCFVAELLEACQNTQEPTIVVLYGDHIPSLDFVASDFTTGDNSQTSYVIWSNYDLDVVDKDLYTYQLYAQVFDMMDVDRGVITRLHQTAQWEDDYLEQLELLQYDMLYGEGFCADGVEIRPVQMTMGLLPPTIEDCWLEGDYYYFSGSQFTASSQIFVNEHPVDTLLMADGSLQVEANELELGDNATACQVSENGTVLATSNEIVIDYAT